MTDFLVSHALVNPPSGAPRRLVLFLHGVFGSGANWRMFARRVVEASAAEALGAVLVDLRMHGASQGAPPPHTVHAAAADLLALEASLPAPVVGVVGHSFGGKVALEYVRQRRGELDTAFVVDATPGARPTARGSEVILRVLELLEASSPRWGSRQEFVATMSSAGIDPGIGQWLAMNLRPDGDAFRFRLDLGAIRALLDDYWERDLWDVIERPPGRVVAHVILGGKSEVFDAADKARLTRAATGSGGRVRAHVLPKAGHWVHVDDPDGLFAIITGR